jgi:hypothetical protein
MGNSMSAQTRRQEQLCLEYIILEQRLWEAVQCTMRCALSCLAIATGNSLPTSQATGLGGKSLPLSHITQPDTN